MPYSLRHSTRATEALAISQESGDAKETEDSSNKGDSGTDTKQAIEVAPTTPPHTVTTTTPKETEEQRTATPPPTTPPVNNDDTTIDLTFWDGEPPEPQGTLATIFTNTDTQADLESCEGMARFLYDNDEDNKAQKLNFDTDLIPFLTAVPNSTRGIRLVYGIGNGLGLTGIHKNDLDNKILALSGEYEEGITFPSVLQFPSTALTPIKLKIPSFDQFNKELAAHNTRSYWFKYADLVTNATLPVLVPFPAVYISDGFEGDLDAANIFERLNAIPNEHQEILKTSIHLLRCFLAATVVRYNKNDPTVIAPLTTFMSNSSPLLNKWKKQKMNALFPQLLPQPTHTPTHVTKVPLPPPPQNNWSPEAFIKAFSELQTKTSESPPTDKDTTSTDKSLGMGTFAYNLLLDLCGLTTSTAEEIIPLWTNLAEKNLTKSDKLTFV